MPINENHESRQLPVVRIHDSDFYVDLKASEFRQVDNPRNAIAFRNVQDNGDHTQLLYDPKTKNAFDGTWQELSARADVKSVRLPGLIDLDRNGLIDLLNQNAEKTFREKQLNKAAGTLIDKPFVYKAKRRRGI